MHAPAAAGAVGAEDEQHGQDACRASSDAACRQQATAKDRNSNSTHTGDRRQQQDQELQQAMPGAVAGSRRAAHVVTQQGKQQQQPADAALAGDHQQARDVAPASLSTAFAASSSGGFPPDCSASVGSDAGSYQRQPRGVEAMLGGQRRTHSGALPSPSGLSEHGSLLVERAASSSSAHRALLGGSSPRGVPAASAALLELDLEEGGDGSPGGVAAAAAQLSGTARDAPQQQQGQVAAACERTAAAAACERTAAAGRRPQGVTCPTLEIPSPPPGAYFGIPSSRLMSSPASGPMQAFPGDAIPYDELDLDAIDDIPSMDALGCSSSSSPTISGAAFGRGSAAGAHLRGSRDLDLRRAALLNTLSPSMQQGTPVMLGSTEVSVMAEGPPMFTGPTRARARPGSNSSLQSVVSGADQYTSSESTDTAQMLQAVRLSRGSTPSPAPTGSPARPRSAAAAAAAAAAAGAAATTTPRMGMLPGTSRGSSAAASPVPPPSHGAAAALLAGSVVASPRTPHSPLSVILSPRPGSARVLGGQGTPLPGPLFGSGFGPNAAAAAGGPDAYASPGTDSSGSMLGQAAAVRGNSILSGAGPPVRRPSRLVPGTPAAAAGDAEQQQSQSQQQGAPAAADVLTQGRQHDTRYGPHGCSPFSPLHHRQELPPRGDQPFSPTCPHSLVPPALTLLGSSSHSRLSADTSAAAAAASPATGAAPAGRSAGSVGHWSIREWLDHHPWSLPYEVPAGLRDAADIRDAAALEQQQQQQQQQHSRLGSNSGSSSSRVPSRSSSNRRISVSSLDSPGGGLLLQQQQQPSPGAFGTSSSRFLAAAAAGVGSSHLAGPVPCAAFEHGCGLGDSQQQVHQHHSHRHLQLELLQGRQLGVLAAEHAARVSCSSLGDDGAQHRLDSSSSPQSCSGGALSSQRSSLQSAATPAPAFQQLSIEVSGPCADMQHVMRFQPASPVDRTGVRAPATLGPHAAARAAAPSLLQRRMTPSPLQHVSSLAADGLWRGGVQGGPAVVPAEAAHGGPPTGSINHSSAWGLGATATTHSSSACSIAVQLGAGHHLFPAGSPVQQGSCGTSMHVPPVAVAFDGVLQPQQQQQHQDVLPGIAELLQRRHEQQQQQRTSSSASVAASMGCHATGVTATACVDVSGPVDAGQVAVGAAAGDPKQRGEAACSSTVQLGGGSNMNQFCQGKLGGEGPGKSRVAAAPAISSSSSSTREVGSSCDSCNAVAGLLCDPLFVTSMIASLPGVNLHSPVVWEAVTELQEALSQPGAITAQDQQQQQLLLQPCMDPP